MSKPSKARRALLFDLKHLEEELSKPNLSASQKRSLMREHSRCALSLGKLEQLELRNRLQAKKPLQPVSTKREPKSFLEQAYESVCAEVDDENARNLLGGFADEPESTDALTAQETPPEDEQDDEEEDEDPHQPEPEAVREREPEQPVDDHWLERSFREEARLDRARQLRAQLLPMPGEVPRVTSEPMPVGEGRFSFSDAKPERKGKVYDPWTDPNLSKPQEPEY